MESLYELKKQIMKLQEDNNSMRDENARLRELLDDYHQFKELLQRLLAQ